jgi:DNA-binding NarL/FixJ family response regulator
MPSRNGRAICSPAKSSPRSRIFDEKKPLTPRELDVARWIGHGKTNQDIGQLLGCSTTTVKKHVQHILEKLGLENRLEICVWCHGEGKYLLPKDGEHSV